ncbi:hypothetical protein BURPS1710A_2794 [Burkholderia pseudomallei 1710a]|uniref:Uncharacterized protein n=1 Tax=Burkholderia pseudomallei 1710a TaxID=320371 RepID=A0A0E1W9E1_BURPE|nr:hypothetical protein BURPS1710A_2794 [Burkholderia pseudomallei 1710a]
MHLNLARRLARTRHASTPASAGECRAARGEEPAAARPRTARSREPGRGARADRRKNGAS